MTVRAVQVGTGNRGEVRCRRFLPPNGEDGTVEVLAAADVDEDALEHAQDALELPAKRCYTDATEAMAAHDADAAALVVPPHVSEDMAEADAKMGATMSHRFRLDITTLRRELRSDVYDDANSSTADTRSTPARGAAGWVHDSTTGANIYCRSTGRSTTWIV